MTEFVGVDPSIRNTGIVTLSNDGNVVEAIAVTPSLCSSLAARAEYIANAGVFAGRVVMIEQPAAHGGGGAFERSVIVGAIMYKAHKNSAIVLYVNPMHVKQFVLGKLKRGEMGKDNVRLAVYKRWGFEHESNDVVDAFALAKMAHAWKNVTRCDVAAQRVLAKVKR